MMNLTAWFIRNPVAANLSMLSILLFGLVTLSNMRVEGFPRIPPESISITTLYSGAPADKVDALVGHKIETALEGLEGVRSLTSYSQEGMSVVTLRRAGGQNVDKLLDKVRLRIEGSIELPERAERPRIEVSAYDSPALYLNLYGDVDPLTLQALSRRLKASLMAEPELSRLKVWGLHEQELRIELADHQLRQLNMTIADVVAKIRKSSLSFQAGSLKTGAGNIYLKADQQAAYAPAYGAIPLVQMKNGDEILLRDVAVITDGVVEGDYRFRFNGLPTSGMEVLVGHRENLLEVSAAVHQVVEHFRDELPVGVEISIWGDSADYIADRLSLLSHNGVQGLLLVFLILALFLNLKLAFWVAMGIPISVMGAISVAGTQWVGYSLNDVTTFGFIIVLGILVDDAVVVGESVFEERRLEKDPLLGTERGVAKVAMATVFGVFTTVAAFLPMMLLDSALGKVLAGFSGVVIFALLFSLFESKLILPAHLAQLNIEKAGSSWLEQRWTNLQQRAQGGLAFARDRLFVPVLAFSITHRYAALLVFISVATLTLGLTQKGKIDTVFFPEIPGQVISVSLEMDPKSPFQLTRSNVDHIHQQGELINQLLQARYDLAQPPIRAIFDAIESPESASIFAELTPVAQRPGLDALTILNQWREAVGQLEGADEFHFSGGEEIGGGLKVKLASRDRVVLNEASQALQQYLQAIEGVHGTRDSLAKGQAQLKIQAKPEAESLGFDPQTLAVQIGYAFGGAEVEKIQRGNDELRVSVLRAKTERDSIDDLMKSHIRNSAGQWLPVASIASIEASLEPKTHYRENGKQINVVSATIDRGVVSPGEIAEGIFAEVAPDLNARYPDLQISLGGELEEMEEMQGGLKKALVMAVVLIYVLMAVPLKSYGQPLIILAIIPFGFVGSIMGHLFMGLPLSLLSFFGMLALAGVVVNDSLVMLSRYNDLRREGVTVEDAIQQAAISRFQAIFLTTATTVIGLLPLLSETSEQAQYLIPAAVSLAYGELFATTLMLLLVPVLIAITFDVKRYFTCPAVKLPSAELG